MNRKHSEIVLHLSISAMSETDNAMTQNDYRPIARLNWGKVPLKERFCM